MPIDFHTHCNALHDGEQCFIDFHTHKPTAEGVITPRSFGIHPWHADDVGANNRDQFFERYGDNLANAEIIGECGLDKACSASWEQQKTLFKWQAEFAAELGKPMVIHCVRAFNEIMETRKMTASTETWVIHGFTGGSELAAQLWKSGIWVSFGAAITDPKREKVRNCLAKIETPFMLETDESEIGIEQVYNAAAIIRNSNVNELIQIIKNNYSRLLYHQEL